MLEAEVQFLSTNPGLVRWEVEVASLKPLVKKFIIEKRARNITVGKEEAAHLANPYKRREVELKKKGGLKGTVEGKDVKWIASRAYGKGLI